MVSVSGVGSGGVVFRYVFCCFFSLCVVLCGVGGGGGGCLNVKYSII